MRTDGAVNKRGAGAGFSLESPEGGINEHSIRLGFHASNNEAEYEALVSGIGLAKELGVQKLKVMCDSQLVVKQVTGVFVARDDRMSAYQQLVNHMSRGVLEISYHHIPREENGGADALANLASTMEVVQRWYVTLERIDEPSTYPNFVKIGVISTEIRECWMNPLIRFIRDGVSPPNRLEARKIAQKASRYAFVNGKLYRRSFLGPLLRCLANEETKQVLEEVHGGVYGLHSAGRSLAHSILLQGYYWPRMQQDAKEYAKKCEQCQRNATTIRAPPTDLHPISSPWIFLKWGIDIMEPFPMAAGQKKFLLVAIDYFSKWIEVKPLARIRATEVRRFLWDNLLCRYGIPTELISDNGKQFDGQKITIFCKEYGIKHNFSTPDYPQANGQVERTNRTLLGALKKRLERSKGRWVEELPGVVWAYRTTKKRVTGETTYVLVYGTEAMFPVEFKLPTYRREQLNEIRNHEGIDNVLEELEEKREMALLHNKAYQGRIKKYFDKKVKRRSFQEGDLVLRRILNRLREPGVGKLGPTWEGPYRVIKKTGDRAYRLSSLNGESIPRPWNAIHLRQYYA